MDTLQQERYKDFKDYALKYADHVNPLWQQLPKATKVH